MSAGACSPWHDRAPDIQTSEAVMPESCNKRPVFSEWIPSEVVTGRGLDRSRVLPPRFALSPVATEISIALVLTSCAASNARLDTEETVAEIRELWGDQLTDAELRWLAADEMLVGKCVSTVVRGGRILGRMEPGGAFEVPAPERWPIDVAVLARRDCDIAMPVSVRREKDRTETMLLGGGTVMPLDGLREVRKLRVIDELRRRLRSPGFVDDTAVPSAVVADSISEAASRGAWGSAAEQLMMSTANGVEEGLLWESRLAQLEQLRA